MQVRSPSGTSSPAPARSALADRQALAGQRRLLDLQRRRDADPAVGGHPVARLDEDDVAGHELLGVDLDRLAVAAHPGDGLHHLGQRLDALLRLRLLAQADHRVEHGQAGQHQRRPDVPGHDQVHDRGDQQHDLHEVLVLAHEGLQTGLLLGAGQRVGAVVLQPFGGLGRAQALGHVHAEPLRDLGGLGPSYRLGVAGARLRHSASDQIAPMTQNRRLGYITRRSSRGLT